MEDRTEDRMEDQTEGRMEDQTEGRMEGQTEDQMEDQKVGRTGDQMVDQTEGRLEDRTVGCSWDLMMERGLWALPVASSMEEGLPLQVALAGALMAQEQVLVRRIWSPPEAKA
jgi:hypothetical protein